MNKEELQNIEDRLRVFGDSFKGLKEQMESLIVTMRNLNDSLNKLKEFQEKERVKDLKLLLCKHCGSTTEVDVSSTNLVICGWCTGESELIMYRNTDLRTMSLCVAS